MQLNGVERPGESQEALDGKKKHVDVCVILPAFWSSQMALVLDACRLS